MIKYTYINYSSIQRFLQDFQQNVTETNIYIMICHKCELESYHTEMTFFYYTVCLNL